MSFFGPPEPPDPREAADFVATILVIAAIALLPSPAAFALFFLSVVIDVLFGAWSE